MRVPAAKLLNHYHYKHSRHSNAKYFPRIQHEFITRELSENISLERPQLGRSQSPLILQMALHTLEDDTVDDVSQRDDQQHDSDHGAHAVKVAAHHQHLP